MAAELGTFRDAVARRFRDEVVRQMLPAGGQPGTVQVPLVVPDQRPALDQVAGLITTIRPGERANSALAQSETEEERQNQRPGMRM